MNESINQSIIHSRDEDYAPPKNKSQGILAVLSNGDTYAGRGWSLAKSCHCSIFKELAPAKGYYLTSSLLSSGVKKHDFEEVL